MVQPTMSLRTFVVVAKARALVRIERGEAVRVLDFPIEGSRIDIVYRTRFVDEGFEDPVGRELWAEISGPADDIDTAVRQFTNAANGVAGILAVSANGSIEDFDLEVAFEKTTGVSERAFLAQAGTPERGVPPNRRSLNIPCTVALLEAFVPHADASRLNRAIGQYRIALRNWAVGSEVLALAHLYMAAEALTPVALRQELERSCLDKRGLIAEWGIEDRQLDAEVRRRIIFAGDDDAYMRSRRASDGFEHGFMTFPEVHAIAVEMRERTAAHIRAALLGLGGVAAQSASVLLKHPFEVPVTPNTTRAYLHGRIIGEGDELAATGHAYPFLDWDLELGGWKREANGEHSVAINMNAAPRFADHLVLGVDGVALQRSRTDIERLDDPDG